MIEPPIMPRSGPDPEAAWSLVPAPSVGRIVHLWVSPNQKAPAAAIVIQVHDGPEHPVNVQAFPADGSRHAYGPVTYGTEYNRGMRWSWPARVG